MIADHQTKHRLLLNLSTSSELILDFSGRSAALDFTTRLSKLFLEASGRWAASCVRGLSEGIISIMSLLLLWAPSFTVRSFEPFFAACLATDEMNFLRWRMKSGYNSRLQWPPPLSHKGVYFTLLSSHSCFPCEQSTTSSDVPWE